MGNRWYVSLDGEELGPLSDTGLERMIQGGRIEGDTLVRNGLGGEWTAASEVENVLAARPSRQRPGQAAIEAAIKAKQPPPRPPAPQTKISHSLVTRPSAAPPAHPPDVPNDDTLRASDVSADTLPAPDELPPAEAPPCQASSEAAAAAPPATPNRSPLVLVATGAGAVLILAVSFFAGWFALRSFTPGATASPAASPAAIDPALAALQQQAEQLRRDLAETKQQLESEPPAPETPPPAEQTPPAAPEPAAKNEPPAASDPGAKPMAASPGADLETQRKELAEMIAMERAVADERERLRQRDEQDKSNAETEFETKLDAEVRKRLAEAEVEVASLDAEQLAARRKEISAAREKRYKEASDLADSARSQIERIEIPQAMQKIDLAILIGPADEGAKLLALQEDLSHATPYHVAEVLESLSDSQIQRLIADERLPDDWPDRIADEAVREVVRKCAVRIAPLLYGMHQYEVFYLQRCKDLQETLDLSTKRKFLFLVAADQANKDGQITSAEVKPIFDRYGAFSVDDLSPLIDTAICRYSIDIVADPARQLPVELAQGKVQLQTFRDVYEKCRKAAGDAWPGDDRPHPLAGRWKGPANWEFEIDPAHDTIAWTRRSPRATFEQRLCKIAPDHLVAYEKRMVPVEHVNTDPFGHEKYNSNDRAPGPDDPLPGQAVAFTYYSMSGGRNTLELRRRILPASFVQENAGEDFWNLIGDPEEYRQFRGTFQRVKGQAQP